MVLRALSAIHGKEFSSHSFRINAIVNIEKDYGIYVAKEFAKISACVYFDYSKIYA